MFEHELELLAPAGKWEVLESAVGAGADAVYLGGKRFNMRMLKPEYNFSNEELIRAADYLHEKGKKLYITVNNLYFENEITELKDYLLFLEEIKVDALIIQDMGVVDLYNELGLNIALHGSVQMGIGSSQSIKFLEKKGLSRVILSKNLSLDEINEIHNSTSMGIEYFAHGDLCISHTGQCYMSNLFFNESSNRGRCKKPCRWKYLMDNPHAINGEGKYYLANKDLCLYPYLAELAKAGVSSFKIEGRMRTAEYVAYLISIYREALDRVLDNIDSYQVNEEGMTKLNKRRVRDYTTGNLSARPGLESIGLTGEREPFFPTTSVKLEPLQPGDYQCELPKNINPVPELTVKVGNINNFVNMLDQGVDNIIISLDFMRQDVNHWTMPRIDEALEKARHAHTRVLLETPRIITEDNLSQVKKYFNLHNIDRLDGAIINDYGSLNLIVNSRMAGKPVWAGSGLNITNSRAVKILEDDGVTRLTAPLEMDLNHLQMVTVTGLPVEVMVHGPVCGLITDLCFYRALHNGEEDKCEGYCLNDEYVLKDEYAQIYRIFTDFNCRNYLFYPYEMCLFNYLPILKTMGIKSIKIEGQYYTSDTLSKVVNVYRQALDNMTKGQWDQKDNYHKLLEMFPQGLTTTPLINNLYAGEESA